MEDEAPETWGHVRDARIAALEPVREYLAEVPEAASPFLEDELLHPSVHVRPCGCLYHRDAG